MFSCSSQENVDKVWCKLTKKNTTPFCTFIHFGWWWIFHEHMDTTFVIAQRWHHSFSLKHWETKGGCWIFGLPLSLSPLHSLNPILHKLMDSILVNHQGWMKLSSFHQLFKALKVVDDRIVNWAAEAGKHLEFLLDVAGFASLPLPHRTPTGRSHIWLACPFRPSDCVGKGTKAGRIRR